MPAAGRPVRGRRRLGRGPAGADRGPAHPAHRGAGRAWPGLLASLYEWTHADWHPTDPAELPELAGRMASVVDGDLSVAAWRDDRVVAAAFAMREGDRLVVGAETMRRATPDGEAIVAATLAGCLRALGAAGVDDVLVDGHLSDDHVGPVLTSFPPEVPRDVLHSVAVP